MMRKRGNCPRDNVLRGALAVGLTAVVVDWDLSVQLLEIRNEIDGHSATESVRTDHHEFV